ncbi:MAG: multidrug ABC transporter [Lachnospiraceae bacterium]|nr:multidrug ABC transporter [Lachnospiraceae bacterium]
MNDKIILYSALYLSGVFISAISQVLLKKEALKEHDSIWKEYLNPKVIIAYAIFFAATFISIWSYKVIPLSMGGVLGTTSYIYVFIFGIKIFHEKMNKKKIIALLLIITGIIVYSLLG